jgi:membrane-bound lytic murein transglycosylase D
MLHMLKISLLGCLLACTAAQVAAATDDVAAVEQEPFPRPADLEPDVRFWIRVYTEVTTDGGLLHDSWNLSLVYEVLRFEPDMPQAARERQIAAAKARYAALLRRFAAGDTENLTAHETRILHAFGAKPTPAQFTEAISRIRFQLGQADRFHEGLIRAQLLERRIAKTLKQNGVPEEIAALPHVESSFNANAYSRVGAAGLWQFMPTTARRYMRVDSVVDERLDPYRATEAAANLMLYNYRLVGTWPLAVTAYNHGPGGLRRVQDDLGTSDIAVIVKHYQGATFGFASRNFYVAFLAALEVDRHADNYFGPVTPLTDADSLTVDTPDYIPVEAAAKAFRVDMGALRVLNPALLPPVWSGARFIPRGYALRIPGSPSAAAIAAAWERVPAASRYLAQRADETYRLHRNETLASIATKTGVPVARLLAANGWKIAPSLRRGEIVRLPLPASRADRGDLAVPPETPPSLAAATAVAVAPTTPAVSATPAVPATAGAAATRPERAAPHANDTLAPAATPTSKSDTTDYGVREGDVVIVQAAETLGHFADWTQSNADELRKLNRLRKGEAVGIGRKLRLDLARVGAPQFTEARRAYHRHLQEAYFAGHRIASTQHYVIKRGDSLWTIGRQHGDLPVWLVTEYNPDVNFEEMRAGTLITLPQVAPINRQ